jgi:hypothetical protein
MVLEVIYVFCSRQSDRHFQVRKNPALAGFLK